MGTSMLMEMRLERMNMTMSFTWETISTNMGLMATELVSPRMKSLHYTTTAHATDRYDLSRLDSSLFISNTQHSTAPI